MQSVKELSTGRIFLMVLLNQDQNFFVKHSVFTKKKKNSRNPEFCVVQEVN